MDLLHRRLTMLVFVNLAGALCSVYQTALFSAIHQNFPQTPTEHRTHTSCCVKVYGELSSTFETTNGVCRGRPISLFLFSFVVDQILQDALGSLQDAKDEKLRYLSVTTDLICLPEFREHANMHEKNKKNMQLLGMCIACSSVLSIGESLGVRSFERDTRRRRTNGCSQFHLL